MSSLQSISPRAIDLSRPLMALAVLALVGPTTTVAQSEEEDERGSPIVQAVRAATQDYRDVNAARAAGYVSTGTCASGPNEGAMGVHYANETFIADGEIDVNRPEILVYEPRNGRLQLVAVEFFVLAEQWDAANEGPPTLEGQHFHYLGAPNRLRLPANYQLHVWAWKRNPKGVFADWNPTVSCAQFRVEVPQNDASGQ